MDDAHRVMLMANVDDSDGPIDTWRRVHRVDLGLRDVSGRFASLLRRELHRERNKQYRHSEHRKN
jgi:hypothetical protein